MIDKILCYLTMIPDTVWAALTASFVTLLGIFVANIHFAKQQRLQLEHEERQKNKELKFGLRQSVYLDAASELTVAHKKLTTLAYSDIEKVNPADGLELFFTTTTKATLVATDETVTAIEEYLAAYMVAFFNLLPSLRPIQGARTERNIQDDLYQKHQSEVTRIMGIIVQLNEGASTDTIVWGALNTNLEFNRQQAANAVQLRGQAWKEMDRLATEHMKAAFSELKVVSKLLVPVLVSMRKELDISSNSALFEERSMKRAELLDTLINKLLTQMEDVAAKQASA